MMTLSIRAVPAIVVTLVFAVMSMFSGYQVSSLLTLQILFILHPLYYWAVFRPSLFPAWFAFLAGFAIDLRAGTLLGLNAFLLVFASLVIEKQQRYLRSQPFATQWAGFFIVCLGAEVIRWFAMGVFTMTLFSQMPALVSGLVSGLCNAALYPLTVLVMGPSLRLISGFSNREKLSN